MKTFWNDEEGLSLLEFIAVWVMTLWGVCMLLVAGMALYLHMKGQQIDGFWIDYIDVFADVPVAVVIGLYGRGAFEKFGQSISGLRNSRNSEERKEDDDFDLLSYSGDENPL